MRVVKEVVHDRKFWQGVLIGCFILFVLITLSIFNTRRTIQAADACPYSSTQAQVQEDRDDAWGDAKTICIGQSVLLGGFHNDTGRFAGDPANTYEKNTANVEFIITDPQGNTQTLLPLYPVQFTPSQVGMYHFVGKTRIAESITGEYYSESACLDSGTITVLSLSSSQVDTSPTPRPTPSVSASPRPTSSATPTPTPSPSISPSPSGSPGIGGVVTNTQPECVSLSGQPVVGGAQLKVTLVGKARDLDGIIKMMEFNFGDGQSQSFETIGETNRDTYKEAVHTYTSPGTYYASVRVKDNSGQSNEWSSSPESCKIKIEVQGSVLATTIAASPAPGSSPVTTTQVLPKSGVSFGMTAMYISLAGAGLALQFVARRLRKIF